MVAVLERLRAPSFSILEGSPIQHREVPITARSSTFKRLVTDLTPEGRSIHSGILAFESFFFISDRSIVQILRREFTDETPDIFRENWFEAVFREPIVCYGKNNDIAFFLDTIFRLDPSFTGPHLLEKSHALYRGERKKHSELDKLRDDLDLTFKNFVNPNYYVQRNSDEPPKSVKDALHARGLFAPLTTNETSRIEFSEEKRSYPSIRTSREQKRAVNQVLASIDPVRDMVKW